MLRRNQNRLFGNNITTFSQEASEDTYEYLYNFTRSLLTDDLHKSVEIKLGILGESGDNKFETPPIEEWNTIFNKIGMSNGQYYGCMMEAARAVDEMLSKLNDEDYLKFIYRLGGQAEHCKILLDYYNKLQLNDSKGKISNPPRIPVIHLIIYLEGQRNCSDQTFDQTFNVLKCARENNGLYLQFQELIWDRAINPLRQSYMRQGLAAK